KRGDNSILEISVLFHESGLYTVIKTKYVVKDQNLAVAACSRTDADRRDFQTAGYGSSHGRGHGFQHERVAARVFQGQCIVNQSPGRRAGAPLRLEAAKLADGLWRQTDVAHDRDSGVNDGPHRRRHLLTSLQLDAVHVAFL